MSLHLSSQNTTRFIELYCQERLLYDTTHINYRNRRLRSAATQRIAQQLGVPGFGPLEVTFKFKNLRNSYSQELKKMDESDYEYYPSVHWFELMNSFLRPFVYTRPVPSLPVAEKPSEGQSKTDTDEESCSSSHNEGGGPASHHRWMPRIRPSGDTAEPTDPLEGHDHASSVKQRRVEEELSVNDMSDSGVTGMSAMDTYEHFGLYIASLLRELGPPESLQLQQEVTSLVLNRVQAVSYIKQEPPH